MDFVATLDALEALLLDARPIPLSTSVVVARRDAEDLAGDLREALPEEIRRARWLLEERDEVLAAAEQEAARLRNEALAEAERLREESAAEAARLVDRTEVLLAARREADRVLSEAREESRRLRSEADRYVDGKLADFEGVLNRTLDEVGRGRTALREGAGVGTPVSRGREPDGPQPAGSGRFWDHERMTGSDGS